MTYDCWKKSDFVGNVKVFPDCQELAQQLKSLFRQVVQPLVLIELVNTNPSASKDLKQDCITVQERLALYII